jgi:tetratricopeptide (TPR) repeat protein/KaiC/GvpD/RAD55 family RecA-like ATPase
LPTILIEGETGTGKGLLARELHERGPRAGAAFVHVNCAAIPETLLEAELFGFERGAFTDARQAKPGLFQTAHRGTLFLDEVGLLPGALQSKLLTAVEDHAVRRLGSTRSESADVWIVAATSENLEAEVKARRFREDLYHRLALVTLRLPALRERGDDVLLLADHFLARACAEYGLDAKRLSADARAALAAYPWPGNIRELANVMERVALLGEAPTVTAAMLELPRAQSYAAPQHAAPDQSQPLRDAVANTERERLATVLRETRWNFTWAAEKLGIPRNTLRYRAARLGLQPEGGPPPLRQRPKTAARGATADTTELQSPSDARPSSDARRERRHVAFLRAIVDAPEDVESARQLEALVDKARLFGGRLEELTPGALVIAFGLEPVEDAPRRAALAAIAIRRAAIAADARVRVAVHVAPVMLEHADDTVGIEPDDRRQACATLEQLTARAAAGEAIVSGAAGAFLRRRFALTQVDSTAYRLPDREVAGLVPTAIRRFVGRHAEIDVLGARFRAAVAGQGQVVGIVGEAGIGKSRLLSEFYRSVATETITILEGPCQSYAAGIPYFPLAAVLRARCGVADNDTAETIGTKVRALLAALGMDARTGGAYLLRLLGADDASEPLSEVGAATIQMRTFEILRQVVLRDARHRPVVLVVEDAHWIDRTSESFLASLAGALAGSPILLVATYRPGYRPPWMDRSYATQIAVPPLSSDESRALVEPLLEAATAPTVVHEIVTRAGGNPFFLEELSRVVSARDDGRTAAPDTIEAVLTARIERLAEPVRRVLETAAVIGREVPARLLRAVSEAGEDLDRHVDELTRLEFLQARAGADDVLYVFKHSLIQDVAYAALDAARRRALHGAVAAALERLHPERREELCEILAHHYRHAGEADKAVAFLVIANRKAADASAMVEAKAHFDTALAMLEAMPDTAANRERRVTLLVDQTMVMTLLFRFEEYQALLARYEPIAAGLGRPALLGAFFARLGLCQWAFGEYQRAVDTLARAAALCESSGSEDDAGQAYVVSQWGRLYMGDFHEVIVLADRLAALMKRRFVGRWHVYAQTASARAYASLGRWAEAIDHATRGLTAAEEFSDNSLIAQSALTAGLVLCAKGDVDAARGYGELALAKAPTRADQLWARAILAWIWCRGSEAARGVPVLTEVVNASRAARWRAGEFYAVWLAEGQMILGATSEAEATLRTCLETAERHGMRPIVGCAEYMLGELALERDADACARHLERSMEILAQIQAENDLALARAAYGRLALKRGDTAGAKAWLARALETFERLGTLREPERLRSLLAKATS